MHCRPGCKQEINIHFKVSMTSAAVLFLSFSGRVAMIPFMDPCFPSSRSSVLAASK